MIVSTAVVAQAPDARRAALPLGGLLLPACLAFLVVGLLVAPSPGLLVGAALAVALLDAAHIVCTWWMIYANAPMFGALPRARFRREFVALPLLYMGVFFVATLLVGKLWPQGVRLWGLAAIAGPWAAHHITAQDRGFVALHSGRPRDAYYAWHLRRLHPLAMIVLVATFVLALVRMAAPGALGARLWGAQLALGVLGALLFVVALVASLRANARNGARARYLASVGLWFASQVLVIAGQGSYLLLWPIHSLRHHGGSVALVHRYFRGRRASGERPAPGNLLEALFLRSGVLLAATTLAVSGLLLVFYASALLVTAGLAEQAYATLGLRWDLPSMSALSYAVVGALVIHHYHLDRNAWRFSDPVRGAQLSKSLFLSPAPTAPPQLSASTARSLPAL
jgi:hypothetical protein